jgi:excisionase family DNA binding protein
MPRRTKVCADVEAYKTVSEVAELLKVTERTVRNWIKQKRLRAVRVGGVIRVSVEELERFVKAAMRIPAKTTTRSDAWRPPVPGDGDQGGAGA